MPTALADEPRGRRSLDDPAIHDRIITLIMELAEEVHATGLIRDHADRSDLTNWNVRGIETCGYYLCRDTVALLRDAGASDPASERPA